MNIKQEVSLFVEVVSFCSIRTLCCIFEDVIQGSFLSKFIEFCVVVLEEKCKLQIDKSAILLLLFGQSRCLVAFL